MPREVCLDVGKEFGAATNTFYKPPCVSVYRCGGCCNSEAHQCLNISTSYISKTVSYTLGTARERGGCGVCVCECVCASVRVCVGYVGVGFLNRTGTQLQSSQAAVS